VTVDNVQRLSIDCKATGLIGDGSRGGLTRGAHKACDHDLGLQEQYIPCGIVDEENGQLRMTFGSSYRVRLFCNDTVAPGFLFLY
jgi:Rhodopirellula transposase DDE domain